MTVAVQLEEHICCTCGTAYAISVRLAESRRQNGGDFYCPNGHAQTYGDTEIKRLRKQITNLTLQAQTLTEEAHRQSLRREKAEKLVRRAHKGVCTLCHRTFTNVTRHMKTKHPMALL